LENN